MTNSIPTLEAIKKRRSVRSFSDTPVSERIVMELLDLANLAPSGYNLQPWHYIVIKNPDIKKLLYHVAMSQSQILEAPFIIAFISNPDAWKTSYQKILRASEEAGTISSDYSNFLNKEVNSSFSLGPLGLFGFTKRITTPIKRLFRPVVTPHTSAADVTAYVYAQTMLSAATFMIAAESVGLSSCPIEGFDEERAKRLLAVPSKMKIALLVALGYPNHANQQEPTPQSVRLPIKEKVSVDIFSNRLDKIK